MQSMRECASEDCVLMEAMARLLTEREDKQIEDVLNLNGKVEDKKGCCN